MPGRCFYQTDQQRRGRWIRLAYTFAEVENKLNNKLQDIIKQFNNIDLNFIHDRSLNDEDLFTDFFICFNKIFFFNSLDDKFCGLKKVFLHQEESHDSYLREHGYMTCTVVDVDNDREDVDCMISILECNYRSRWERVVKYGHDILFGMLHAFVGLFVCPCGCNSRPRTFRIYSPLSSSLDTAFSDLELAEDDSSSVDTLVSQFEDISQNIFVGHEEQEDENEDEGEEHGENEEYDVDNEEYDDGNDVGCHDDIGEDEVCYYGSESENEYRYDEYGD